MKWNLAEELDFFAHFDIGIMPLKDSPFARGKCAFKLVQYMAVGLPVIASPVGANCELVEHGWNGYLADTQDEWHSMLRLLIDDPALRRRMGKCGRDLARTPLLFGRRCVATLRRDPDRGSL
jgi:glycosyltransferase involved in cell wall biosynthesis